MRSVTSTSLAYAKLIAAAAARSCSHAPSHEQNLQQHDSVLDQQQATQADYYEPLQSQDSVYSPRGWQRNKQLTCYCIQCISAPMHDATRQTSNTCRFNEAVQSEQISEANAMCIATATPEGRPSSRMVLMKGYDQRGFKFYSNYSSRKGQELERNSYASLCFWWEPLHRSVGLLPKFLQLPCCSCCVLCCC